MSPLAHASPSAPPNIDGARRHAVDAAAAAGVSVDVLATMPQLTAAVEAWNTIWGRPDGQQMLPPEMLRAMTHAGNYASGALRDGRLVGAAFGFLGEHAGVVHLHSHIAGVHRGTRYRGIGYALKLHQRAWALERALETVTWTFDPLVRGNAYFNLSKLGAVARDYEVDFYGSMDDGFNAGDETDRLVVTWELSSARVEAAVRGEPTAPSGTIGEPVLREADDGTPVQAYGDGPVLRVRVPDDIVALRQEQPDVARSWRSAVRDTLGTAIADGYTAVGMTRDGWYILSAHDASPGQDTP